MKIVILERNSVGLDISIDCFKELGEVVTYPNTVSFEDIRERVKDADIIVANKAKMIEETLKDAPNVKMIQEFATGYDNCDLAYCRSRGINVCNVVDYSSAAVAQHTITLALCLLENIPFYDNYVKSGTYMNQDRFSNFDAAFTELEGKTWGIVGMGNIGKRVAKIAEAFGCKVIFHSLTGKSKVTEYPQVDKDTLLQECDFISLHCPLSDLSRGFIDAEALKKMKKTAVLINVARGPVVDNTALYEALVNGEIAAAGLDVLEKEPITPENPLSKFMDSNRLIITPHMAWASTEARIRCVQWACDNVRNYLEGHPTNVVNP